MGILNYSTEIPIERTIAEIEKMLADNNANRIIKDYDKDKNITAINFLIKTEKGTLPFKLPMNVKAVMQIINNQTEEFKQHRYGRDRIVPKKFYNDYDQARKVGWRIIKDWLEAQLALYQLRMVKIEEIFLPYIIGIDGKTLFEHLEGKGFQGYLLEDMSKNE